MKRAFVFLLVLIFLASTAAAQARPVVKHRVFDKKFLAVTALSVGLSVAASFTLARCRHDHGIGPCSDGGYGEFKAREVLRQVQTGFLILPTWKLKSVEDEEGAKHKFWWIFEAANAGLNAGVIAENRSKHYRPKELD